MQKTEKKVLAVKFLQLLVIIGAILGIIIPVIMLTDGSKVHCDELALDEHWNVAVHGQAYEDVTLSGTHYGMCNKGDVLELQTVLPDVHIAYPVLRCYSIHATVAVYLDDALIYTYGEDQKAAGKMLGYGWHTVGLPDDYEGKTLKMVYGVTENNAFDGLPTSTISDSRYTMIKEFASAKVNLTISLFLILFGMLGMILSLVMYLRTTGFLKTFCIMLFSFALGIWTMTNGDLILFFTTNLRVKVYLEYLSFYFLTIPILLYFADYTKKRACPRVIKAIYSVMLAAEVALYVFIIVMQQTNILHFSVFVPIEHAVFLVTLVFILVLCYSEYKRTEATQKGLVFGLVLAGLLAILEIISFNLRKFFTGFSDNKYHSAIGLAALVIVLSLLVDFCIKIMQNLQKEAQRQLLEKIAYVDELTGVFNRRHCDEEMVAIEKTDRPYAIVGLDMNLLKHINDTYGHEAGDAALQTFADVLKDVFKEPCSVGRMGGDEFFVLIPEATDVFVDHLIDELNEKMNSHTVRGTDVKLSASYGVAYGRECANAHAVYSLADQRMYEQKRRTKMERKD